MEDAPRHLELQPPTATVGCEVRDKRTFAAFKAFLAGS